MAQFQSVCNKPLSSNKKTDLGGQQLKKLQALANSKAITPDNQTITKMTEVAKNTFKLDWTDISVSKEEVFSEYLIFLRGLANIVSSEKDKLVNLVRTKLRISEIEKSMDSFHYEKLLHLKEGSNIIDQLSAKIGQSLR